MSTITSALRVPIVIVILAALLGGGCGTRKVIVPQLDTTAKADFAIKGRIIYDGNKEYLPTTIVNDNTGNSFLAFKYTHNTIYGKDNTSQLLPLFNPLSIVGFPIGGNTLVVTGNMEVLRAEKVVKSYNATCGIEVTRNLFYEGDTYSELRRECLIELRKNIEAQMYRDRETIASLMADK